MLEKGAWEASGMLPAWASTKSIGVPRLAYRYAIAVVMMLVLVYCWHDTIGEYSSDLTQTYGPTVFRRPLKVAVLETKGCHDEVSAGFFSALGQMSECRVEAYLQAQRYEIDAIYDELPGFERRHLHAKKDFQPSRLVRYSPDVVISITSEHDLIDHGAHPALQYLLNSTQAVLFAVVHHPDELIKRQHWVRRLKMYRPWIEAGRLRFITLSEHVTDFLMDNVVADWVAAGNLSIAAGESLRANTFPAVFNIPGLENGPAAPRPDPLHALSEEDEATTTAAATPTPTHNPTASPDPEKDITRLAMQGDLVVQRSPNRNYKGTFKRFSEIVGALPAASRDTLEMYVLGDGKLPSLPKNVTDAVHFEVGAAYPEFYSILASADALIPALANDEYIKSKASSTIPASLIAGAPLVADRGILGAYTFLTEEDVYFREEGEDEMDVAARIAALPREAKSAKSAALRAKNRRMVKESSKLMRAMIKESINALPPMPQAIAV